MLSSTAIISSSLSNLSIAPVLAVYFALIAGGRDPISNEQSHQEHLLNVASLLDEHNISRDHITVFWADGTSSEPDRLLPHPKEEQLVWVVKDTPWEGWLEQSPILANTEWVGFDTHRAQRSALRQWLKQLSPKLKPRDSVVFIVTDHGAPDPRGGWKTAVELWGEQLSVDQLYQDLQLLPSHVQILLWMSQCYSGGFARLAAMDPRVCGAFSSTANRPAYGCFSLPKQRGVSGHFTWFTRGLKRSGRLDLASRFTAENDETPDTPHLSSEAFIGRVINERSEALGIPPEHIVDGALPRVSKLDADQKSVVESITRISLKFNLGFVRSYGHARLLLREVQSLQYMLQTWHGQWSSLTRTARLRLLHQAPLEGFNPKRDQKHKRRGSAKLKRWIKRSLRRGLEGRRGLLKELHQRTQRVERLLDQLKSIEASLWRISSAYTSIAAPHILSQHDRKLWEKMRACEARSLLGATPPREVSELSRRDTTRTLTSFPSLSELLSEAESLRPGYLAFRYRERSRARSVEVREVEYGSSLWMVDLKPFDLIESIEGEKLKYAGQTRELIALHPVGELLKIKRRRGRKPRLIYAPVVGMPILHPPPVRGELVPPLSLDTIDGKPFDYLMTGGRPTLLYFWATWCKECIRIAPMIKRWAQSHDVIVLAITTEDPYLVQAVNASAPLPFPVLYDRGREATRLFNVNLQDARAPVFVYIDVERRFIERGVGLGRSGPQHVEELFDP